VCGHPAHRPSGPNTASTRHNGQWYTLFPERVNFTEAQAQCAHLPGGSLAILQDSDALHTVGNALLPTLPMQYSLQLAWVGAVGVGDNWTALILSGDSALQPAAPGAQQGSSDNNTAAAAVAAGMGPRWLSDNGTVRASLYTHPGEEYLSWRGSDAAFSKYVPEVAQPVCLAVLGVSPPTTASSLGPPTTSHTRPGLYAFTCQRPTAFICQCECGAFARGGLGFHFTTAVTRPDRHHGC
jgi:hypothetical protein